MNKRINFEDIIFILAVRIRMIRDLLQLDTEPDLFFRQTVVDLEFIASILDLLAEKFVENLKFLDREAEADNILDAEWQFCQLLNEISKTSSPFSSTIYSELPVLINKLSISSITASSGTAATSIRGVKIPETLLSSSSITWRIICSS